jgi:hypothetical protein
MNKAVDIPEYDIFTKSKDDDKPGMSYDDTRQITANTNVPHSLVMVEQLPRGCCPVSYP